MKRIANVAVLLMCTTAVVGACSESSSSPGATDAGIDSPAESAPPTDGATTDALDAEAEAAACTLPGRYGSDACNECVQQNCCAFITACVADTECALLQQCALGCLPKPDASGCYTDCLTQHASGRAKWDAVFNCWFDNTPNKSLGGCGAKDKCDG